MPFVGDGINALDRCDAFNAAAGPLYRVDVWSIAGVGASATRPFAWGYAGISASCHDGERP